MSIWKGPFRGKVTLGLADGRPAAAGADGAEAGAARAGGGFGFGGLGHLAHDVHRRLVIDDGRGLRAGGRDGGGHPIAGLAGAYVHQPARRVVVELDLSIFGEFGVAPTRDGLQQLQDLIGADLFIEDHLFGGAGADADRGPTAEEQVIGFLLEEGFDELVDPVLGHAG
ncbi:MAG: hypothetical protein IPG45_02260 [Deltaproteobacteria bacterium]|nr:hypothetical protein [Deltaproteobacteria bacterium]